MPHTMPRMEFDGHIMGASFGSGDRFVAGRWHRSPIGPFADVMWCRPDGHRVLFAPNQTVATFIAHHYAFDEVRLESVRVERGTDGEIVAETGSIRMVLRPLAPGVASGLLALRPRRLRTATTWIGLEDRVLRPLVRGLFAAAAVRTTGETRAGAREWYAIHDFREADAAASIDGVDLGAPAPCAPSGFGFSEFPAGPALVRVTSILKIEETAISGTLRRGVAG